MEKPIDFWLRKGKTGGEPKSTETKKGSPCIDLCDPIAERDMAEVKWMKGIEYVSGLMSKRPKKGDAHSSHGSALLATHRVAPTTNPVCTRLYALGAYNRSTPLSSREIANQARFTAVRALIAARKQDLTKIATDQAAFIAQRDTANGKKTMNAYYWMVCGAEYDEAQNG